MIYELRHEFKVVDLTKVASIPRSNYYYWVKHREPDKYQKAKEAITEIYHEHRGRYGHRQIQKELMKRNYHQHHPRSENRS